MGHCRHSTNDVYGQFAPDFLQAAKDCAEAVLADLEALCKRSIYRDVLKPSMQVSAKSDTKPEVADLQRFDPVGKMVGGTGIEPVTPTMSTPGNPRKNKSLGKLALANASTQNQGVSEKCVLVACERNLAT
jgi:hypothetical protein